MVLGEIIDARPARRYAVREGHGALDGLLLVGRLGPWSVHDRHGLVAAFHHPLYPRLIERSIRQGREFGPRCLYRGRPHSARH